MAITLRMSLQIIKDKVMCQMSLNLPIQIMAFISLFCKKPHKKPPNLVNNIEPNLFSFILLLLYFQAKE